MELQEFEDLVRRQRPTEITAEAIAKVRRTTGHPRHGSAASPRLAHIPGRPSTGMLTDMFEARFTVDDLEYGRQKPSDERWLLQT